MNTSAAHIYIVTSLCCGRDHTLALLANGKVIGWGGDGSGRVAPDTPGYAFNSSSFWAQGITAGLSIRF